MLSWLAKTGAGCLSDRALETLSECVIIKGGMRTGAFRAGVQDPHFSAVSGALTLPEQGVPTSHVPPPSRNPQVA